MASIGATDTRPKALHVSAGKCLFVERLSDRETWAIGTTGLLFCIGMYVEQIPSESFCWHIFGSPMTAKSKFLEETETYVNIPAESPIFAKISDHVRSHLQAKLGNCTNWGRRSLVLATNQIGEDANMAIVNGVLEWARVEKYGETTKAAWKEVRLEEARGFVVKKPGEEAAEGSVEYFKGEVEEVIDQQDKWKWIFGMDEDDGVGFPLDMPSETTTN